MANNAYSVRAKQYLRFSLQDQDKARFGISVFRQDKGRPMRYQGISKMTKENTQGQEQDENHGSGPCKARCE